MGYVDMGRISDKSGGFYTRLMCCCVRTHRNKIAHYDVK